MPETVIDLLTEAYLDLGVIAEGEPLSAAMANTGLSKLNSMFDSWNLEKLTVYGSTATAFPLVSGQTSYTMGWGGNFNVARPIKIVGAYIRDVSVPAANRMDLPLQILTDKEYRNYPYKSDSATIPFGIWVNYTAPMAVVTLLPAATNTNFNLILWQESTFSSVSLYQEFAFAQGYRETIVANLALRLSPSYAAKPSDFTANLAVTGKRRLQSSNVQVNALTIDPLLTQNRFNQQTGNFQ